MENQIPIKVEFSDESEEHVVEALNQSRATEVTKLDQAGFAALEIVYLAVVGIPMLINLILKLVKLWSCGVVIDARIKPVSTKKDCKLPRGSVLIISPDNTRIELKEPSDGQLKDQLEALKKLLNK